MMLERCSIAEICLPAMSKEIKNGKGELGAGIMPLVLPSLATADLAKYMKKPVLKISFVGFSM